MALVDGSDIRTGQQFPPKYRTQLNGQMARYRAFSEGRFSGLSDLTAPRLTPNVFRFIMDFWKDAVVGDAPIVDYDGGDPQRRLVERLTKHIGATARSVVQDMIRYGTGVFYNRLPYEIQSLDPQWWFPVVAAQYGEPTGLDIVAYPYATGPDNTNNRLHVAINTGGVADVREYRLSGLTIGDLLAATEVPVGQPALVGVTENGQLFGASDYDDILPYVVELHRRESGLSLALDRHVNPHLAVPESVMKVDVAGNPSIDLSESGNVMPVGDGEIVPQYVSWEARFEAQSAAIDRADKRILRASRISSVLVRPDEQTGAIASGAALRRMSVPTVQRIKVIRNALSTAIATAMAGNSQMVGGGFQLDPDKILITWPAALGTGITDEHEAIRSLVEAGILEREAAVQLVNRVSRREAERIVAEAASREEDENGNQGQP